MSQETLGLGALDHWVASTLVHCEAQSVMALENHDLKGRWFATEIPHQTMLPLISLSIDPV